jgi:L-alanine-DL-glutamate epimerase-like enolase superfamily enzyme
MKLNRRQILAGAVGAAVQPALAAKSSYASKARTGPSMDDLARVASLPILRRDGLSKPVIIRSIELLHVDKEYFVRIRSTDGAEGISVCNPPRADYLDRIFKDLVAPVFLKKDARDVENLLWDAYRHADNYKLYGIALWSPLAWVEMAILDMLGRMNGKSIGQLLGDVRRKDIAVYVASGRRDTTPPQEIEYLQSLVEKSKAKALKFRLGGRMSRNADAMPGRTETLIPLVRKTFGDDFDLHGDSNSSYDPAHAIPVGRMLEEYKYVYYEEPCEFDALEDNKKVRDTLSIPIALGEQEYSEWRFRWTIANRVCDIVQPFASSRANGGVGQNADHGPHLRRLRLCLHAPFRQRCGGHRQVSGVQVGHGEVWSLVRSADHGEERVDECPHWTGSRDQGPGRPTEGR